MKPVIRAALIAALAWLTLRLPHFDGELFRLEPAWYDPLWVIALIVFQLRAGNLWPVVERVQRWSFRHHKLVLAGLTLSMLACLPGALKLEVMPVFDGTLPQDNPKVAAYEHYESLRSEHSFLLTLYREGGLLDLETFDLLEGIQDRLEDFPGVDPETVLSYRNIRTVARGEDGITEVRELDRIVEDAPEDESEALLRELVKDHPLAWGRLIDKSEKMAVVQVRYDPEADRPGLYEQSMALVEELQAAHPEYEFGVTGFDILEQQVMKEILFTATILSTLAAFLMIFKLAHSFGVYRRSQWNWRAFSGVVFSMGPLTFFPVAWVMGGLGWLDIPIDTVSSVIPIVFIAIASSYGVHSIYHVSISHAESLEDRVVEGTHTVIRALFTSAATTAIGLLTLAPFAIVSIRKFGLFGGAGVALMLFVVVVAMPAWVRLWPVPESHEAGENELTFTARGFERLALGALTHPVVLTLALLAVIGWGAWKAPELHVGSTPTRFLRPSGLLPQTSARLMDHFGADGALFLSVETGEEGGLLEPDALRTIQDLAAFAENQELASYVQHFAEEQEYLNERFAENEGLPGSGPLIAQLLLVYEMAGSDSQFISFDRSTAYLIVWGNYWDSVRVEKLYQALSDYGEEHDLNLTIGSEYGLWLAQIGYIVRGKFVSWAQSFVLIWLLGWAVFGTALSGLVIVLPLLLVTLLVLAIMAVAGISLDIASVTITSMTIGVGADYAIHTFNAWRTWAEELPGESIIGQLRATVRHCVPPIVYDSQSNWLGFGIFILSDLTPVANCGYLLVAAMLAATLAALTVVPFLVRVLQSEYTDEALKIAKENG